ncbi:MAG TPA: helix-turn-helix domain-containing protein, partial [Fimbriimonadaceae bacterium]|nr:helix-turn-helix domain-containing protein [Fimbriimonadaceae bacterium]
MKIDRRGQILDTSFEIVHEHGLEGLHARTVAARIGINHAAVHYYFPKREDLILALCERLGKRLSDDRATALESTDRLKGHFQQARAY